MATLYLNEQQSIVKKRDEYLIIQYPDKRKTEIPLIRVSQVVVAGDVTLTTPALHSLLERGIEVCFLSMYGHFRGRLLPPVAKNALIRREQYGNHTDPQRALQIAQACVKGKPGGMHQQSFGAMWSSISLTCKRGFTVLIERDSSNATMPSCALVDVPRIISRISSNMGRELIERDDGLLVQRTKIRDIPFIEWLGILGKNDRPIISSGSNGNTSAIAPDEFFFLFD